MIRKLEIPAETRFELDKLREQSAQEFSSGDLQTSLRTALLAWELIPDPKQKWDYYPQSLSSGFVIDFADFGDKESCDNWIETMALMYDDPNREDHQVLMQEGEAMYKLGDTNRAFWAFFAHRGNLRQEGLCRRTKDLSEILGPRARSTSGWRP